VYVERRKNAFYIKETLTTDTGRKTSRSTYLGSSPGEAAIKLNQFIQNHKIGDADAAWSSFVNAWPLNEQLQFIEGVSNQLCEMAKAIRMRGLETVLGNTLATVKRIREFNTAAMSGLLVETKDCIRCKWISLQSEPDSPLCRKYGRYFKLNAKLAGISEDNLKLPCFPLFEPSEERGE
jgi:hypothetical protein